MTGIFGSKGSERKLLCDNHFISIGLNAFGGMQCFAASRENFSVGIDVVFFRHKSYSQTRTSILKLVPIGTRCLAAICSAVRMLSCRNRSVFCNFGLGADFAYRVSIN